MQDSRKDQRYVAGFSIIKELAKHLCSPLPPDDQKRLLKHSIKLSASPEAWATSTSSLSLTDEQETALTLKVEQQLKALNKEDAIPRFNQLYRLLKHRGSSLLNNRQGLLTFFSRVSEGQSKDAVGGTQSAGTLGALSQEDVKNRIFRNEASSAFLGANKSTASNASGISRSVSAEFVSKSRTKRPTSLIQNISTLPEEKSIPSRSLKSKAMSTTALSVLPSAHSTAINKKGFVSETRVVKELLFCFQGIAGSIFKQDPQKGFSIDPLVKVPHESLVLKLMELGYLNNRITNQCAQLEQGGAVAQAIHAGVKRLMNDFYAMIGCIHSEYLSSLEYVCDTPLSEDSYSMASLGVGIFKLMVICREPLRTLKLLSDAIKFALTGKGGAALSAIEVLRHHGDLRYSSIMHHIVGQAGKPLVHMIIEWMVHGTLSDPHDEFFITINSSCHERDIWRDKFILRSSLIPSVLTSAQADMILKAGKGIHFLNV
ncbi:hypothetical protein GE061_017699, partial [Apolygus lucorum]